MVLYVTSASWSSSNPDNWKCMRKNLRLGEASPQVAASTFNTFRCNTNSGKIGQCKLERADNASNHENKNMCC